MNETQLAARFGCTVDQIRANHADNGRALKRMLAKALVEKRKINGYSATQLAVMLADAEKLAKGQSC